MIEVRHECLGTVCMFMSAVCVIICVVVVCTNVDTDFDAVLIESVHVMLNHVSATINDVFIHLGVILLYKVVTIT